MAVIVNGTEIALTGDVGNMGGWFFDEDNFTHSDVITALAQVGRDTDITVRVNSGGGIATEGAAIHAAFAQHKGKVSMVVEGWAASAASLLIMAGDTVTMRPGSLLMIHDPSGGMWGTAADHNKCASALDVLGNTYAAVYGDKTGKKPDEMRAIMREEVWYGPAEAVAAGFADSADTSNDNEVEPVAFGGLSAYQRPPERIVALAKARGWAMPAAAHARQSAERPATAHQGVPMSDKPEATEATTSEKPADANPAPVVTETAADPLAIAKACADASMPATMAESLMRAGATMAAVNDRIATAKAITEAATLAGMPGMGAKLAGIPGITLDSARDLIAEARASKDEAVMTDTAHGNGPAVMASGWDAAVASLKPRK